MTQKDEYTTPDFHLNINVSVFVALALRGSLRAPVVFCSYSVAVTFL